MTTIYAIMIVIGFVPFIITLYKQIRMHYMRKNGSKATAVVKEISGYSLGGMSRVLIEFLPKTGQLVSKEIMVAGTPYKKGDRLPLIYKKDNPAITILDSGKSYYAIVIIAFLLGLFVIGACFLIQGSIEKGEI